MKKTSYIIVVLSFFLLSGLTLWQIKHLKKSHQLKSEIQQQEMQMTLMESAIAFRQIENKNRDLQNDMHKQRILTDSILNQHFKKFDQKVIWGFYDGLRNPIDDLNSEIMNSELANSNIKVCVSCLLMIGIVERNDDDYIDSSDIAERGYILDHTPAQMRSIQGLDLANLRYIHIQSIPIEIRLVDYIIPSIFLLSLSLLFIWLLYLNSIQSKLIQQKNEFVNHLSHQFQTPLSSIKLSANLLAKKEMDHDDDLVQIIQTESNRLENHIKTVLHWVKSDADRLQIIKEEIGVTHIIEQSIRQMKPVFITNHTTVNFIPPAEEIYVSADRNHLQLMLFNIWENAIKHNEKSISLTIDCQTFGKHIIITSSDNGKGLQQSGHENFKGLGLAYVKRIMQKHNGDMILNSGIDHGLSVQLKFPKND